MSGPLEEFDQGQLYMYTYHSTVNAFLLKNFLVIKTRLVANERKSREKRVDMKMSLTKKIL
jgi:hypothetical protein